MSILNYIKVCEKNVAGNMYLFLTEASNVLDVTVTSGEVTEIFMVSDNTFKQIQADQNGIIRQIKQLGIQGKEYYEHFVNFVCGKANKELNTLADSLSEASPCGIIAIVMDSNGQAWLVGWNETDDGDRPLYLNIDNFTSGKDLTEAEGGKRSFDLKTTSAFLDLPLDSTLNDYIKSEIMLGLGNAITLGFSPQFGPELNTTANATSDPAGAEADATTGWVQIGLDAGANVFESQGAVKNAGGFALHADADDTPTASALFSLDLEAAPFNFTNGEEGKVVFDSRHIGSNGNWVVGLNSGQAGSSNTIKTLTSADIAFTETTYEWVHSADRRYLNCRELSVTNNGGMYFDNLSIRKKL